MRILAKIVLFPVVVALTVLVAACRFICAFSGALLGVVAFLIFLVALGTIFLLRDVHYGITALIMAFAVSPYGIPLFVSWIVNKLDDLNFALRSI